jgi:predicted acylesterase/phospholipase RssA
MTRTEKHRLLEEVKRTLRERKVADRSMSARQRDDAIREGLLLVEQLKTGEMFDYACRLLELLRDADTGDDDLRLKLAQTHAFCTYKNQDQPVLERLDAALGILEQGAHLSAGPTQEALGLAGSIYKQKWLVDGQKQHLEMSFRYYYRGHQHGVATSDLGYTGINAAFVLDLLGEIEADAEPDGFGGAAARRALAREIRKDIVAGLKAIMDTPAASGYWAAVTLGEAYFGLGDYDNALAWLQTAKSRAAQGWQRETTARQLAHLASIQERAAAPQQAPAPAEAAAARVPDGLDPAVASAIVAAGLSATREPGPSPVVRARPYDVVREFLDLPEDVIRGAFLGKVGLALSGGGFRASLFHIGVLARLAEHDILRRVEVLSCVSGGSIIGAHYYLELRHLLQSKTDDEISRNDYVELVQRVAARFLQGVQRNVRMRALASLPANLRMIFSSKYSRTHRLGELYEAEIFSLVNDGGAGKPRYLDQLEISPKGAPEGFHPRWDNWQRRAKVPALVLNATSLNTGHLWQFTASFMGEPASSINTSVDGNYRLRRMWYGEAPPLFRKMRLGYAVAASSCVPGLFEPLQFTGLYPDITVSLVDGGVHDNQGLIGVMEQGCDNLIVSDASGQMDQEDAPSSGFLNVVSRSNSVLQARLRDVQLRDLDTRGHSSIVRSAVVHLKQELLVAPRDWAGCDDPKETDDDSASLRSFTTYGIRRDVQRLLAGVRTDLDAFCDAEAMALMLSGYRMTDRRLALSPVWNTLKREPAAWPFQRLEPAMTRATDDDRLMCVLRTASSLPFKAWRLVPALRYLSMAFLAAVVVGLVYVHLQWGPRTLADVAAVLPESLQVRVGDVIFVVVGLAVSLLGLGVVARALQLRGAASRAALGIGVATVGWLVALVHLAVFDRLYLSYGRHDQFKE